jgi:hypothetical protein
MQNATRMVFATTAAALLCAAAPARAAEPGPDTLPINVIAVQTSDVDDQAEALTKALRSAVRQIPGWSLGEGDYSLEVLTLSLKCPEPPDLNCQSRIADQIKADRYIWGTLKKKDKKSGQVKADLNLWVRGKGTSKWPVEYSANLTDQNDDSLKRIAADAISNLTGGPPKGSIHVKAAGVGAQVFVDGQPIGALKGGEGSFPLPAGPHKVTVKAVGYADYDAQVVVRPTGAPTEVNTTLVSAGSGPANWKRIGGFAALGVGVATAVVGFVSMAQVNSAQGILDQPGNRDGVSPSGDVCTAKAGNTDVSGACSKGKTFQTVQIAMFPVAAVAGGVGIFLLATAGKSAPPPGKTGWTVLPQVGPGSGKLDLTYTF